MNFDREMQRALEADGEKLRQLTGEDHGPWFIDDEYPGQAPCPNCFESSGYMGHLVSATWTDPAYEDADYSRRCQICNGTGTVDSPLATLDDLENSAADEAESAAAPALRSLEGEQ